MKRVKKSISRITERSRYRLIVPLMFKVIEATQEKIVSDAALEATTIDVSSGGVRFHCDLPLRLGDVLKIKLIFPAEDFIAIGKVVRIEAAEETDESIEASNAIALEFIELPSDRRERIRQLITPTLSLKLDQEQQEDQEEQQEGSPTSQKIAFDAGDFLPKKPE